MKRRRSPQWLRIVWPFLLFGVVGGTALVGWMQAVAVHESQAVFSALARTNAEFLRTTHLPESEQMMGYLGRMLNVRAYLSPQPGEWRPALPPELAAYRLQLEALSVAAGPRRLGREYEAIAAPLDGAARLLLVRPAEPALQFLQRRDLLAVLAVFCLLSAALASVAGRRLLRTERLALLGELATGLAHEIHNPLSTIRLHSQLLASASAAELAATVEQAAPVLLAEGARIEALVNQWMFLARPEPPRTRAILLAPVVERLLRTYAAQARHTRVALEAAVPAHLAVQADERRLEQALGNLVLNGLQAMARGGVLRLSAEQQGERVRLAVADSGPGFSPAALERGRELFYSEKEGGMGVGLSVASEVMEAHGGRLEVANEAGGGGVVRVYLPSAAPAAAAP